MVPGMAAEHSGSQHAKHMWHHTRKHAAFDRQKNKKLFKLCCMVLETDVAQYLNKNYKNNNACCMISTILAKLISTG
jgi:hypothetical protein